MAPIRIQMLEVFPAHEPNERPTLNVERSMFKAGRWMSATFERFLAAMRDSGIVEALHEPLPGARTAMLFPFGIGQASSTVHLADNVS
jgi:hypothetical protein